MSTLAITDALLSMIALSIMLSTNQAPSFRLVAGLFASAAVLGVLRFSGLLPLPTLHSFFSGLGATSAFPLLAASLFFSTSAIATQWRFASIFAIISGAFGLVASALEFSLWGNAVAIISVVTLLLRSIIAKDGLALLGATFLFLALLLFALSIPLAYFLQPGDSLHLFMTLGLLALGVRGRRQKLKEQNPF
jgi:hypothetical protein